MRTPALLAAVGFVAAGLLAGCQQTTSGTLALTTESGAPTSRTTTSRTTPRSTTRRSTPSTSANSAPPSDVLTLTCADYVILDADAQTAVLQEILTEPGALFGPGDVELAKILVDGACPALPELVVSQFLLGEPPP